MEIKLSKSDFELNDKGVLVARKGLYGEKLEEATDLSLDTVRDVEKFNGAYVAAAIKTSGEMAQDAMAEDESIADMKAIAAMYGSGNVAVTHTRHRVERNPRAATPEEGKIDVYGGTRINVTTSFGLKTGSCGSARAYLKEIATKRFGGE